MREKEGGAVGPSPEGQPSELMHERQLALAADRGLEAVQRHPQTRLRSAAGACKDLLPPPPLPAATAACRPPPAWLNGCGCNSEALPVQPNPLVDQILGKCACALLRSEEC